jgi:lipoate-protein ligase B
MGCFSVEKGRGLPLRPLEKGSGTCRWSWLGLVDYEEAYTLQKNLWKKKNAGLDEDFLLFLEHSPSLTVGRSGKLTNLLVSREELAGRGITLYSSDRGGDITYHGPGQLMVYPILDLRLRGQDIRRYVYEMQEVVIRVLRDFSIIGERDPKYVGVWVGGNKICAIGVAVHRWITMHGLALNINTELDAFSLINPCGIEDRGVTSLAKLKGNPLPVPEVVDRFLIHFSLVFDMHLLPGAGQMIKKASGV